MSDWTQERCNEICRQGGIEAAEMTGLTPDFEAIKDYMKLVGTRDDIINHMEFLNSVYEECNAP